MSQPTSCYTDWIGLSRTQCECLDPDNRPADADTSLSGLYLDELEGLNLQQVRASSENCGEYWDMLEGARRDAMEQMPTDLLACVRGDTQDRRKPSRSTIGDYTQARSQFALKSAFHGMVIQLADHVGGTATLYRIGGKFAFTQTLAVSVWDRDGEVPLAVCNLQTVAGKMAWFDLPTPLELDMTAEGGVPKRYFLLYEPAAPTDQAYNVRIHCGCGGLAFKPNWNEERPYYASQVNRGGFGWSEWMMASGVKLGTLADRDFSKTTSNETQGLVIDMGFTCDYTGVVCPEVPDFTDPLVKVQAYAMWLLAGYKLLTRIKMSSNPTFWTMLNGDGIEEQRGIYMREYQQRVEGFLCPQFSSDDNVNRFSDCLICKDKWGMSKSTIRP